MTSETSCAIGSSLPRHHQILIPTMGITPNARNLHRPQRLRPLSPSTSLPSRKRNHSLSTIPDMARIIQQHNLAAVPVDIQDDGRVCAKDMEALITRKTKAILIAHLFGTRMPLDAIVVTAKRLDLILFEDCAEAFSGLQYPGHPGANISLFSFGTMKT